MIFKNRTKSFHLRWPAICLIGFIIGFAVVLFFQPGKKRFPIPPGRDANISSIPPRSSKAHPAGKTEIPEPRKSDKPYAILHGRLIDGATLGPVPGGLVSYHDDPTRAAESDMEGLFELVVPDPAQVLTMIHKDGYPPTHLKLMEVPQGRVDILLFKELHVSALVSDDVTSAPIPGARVTLDEPAGAGSAVTDAEGKAGPLPVRPFLILGHDPGETLHSVLQETGLVVESAGYKTLKTRVKTEGNTTMVLLRLRPVSTLKGQVVDRSSSPVPWAKVVAHWGFQVGWDTTEFGSSLTLSGEQGLFDLEVPAGRDLYLQVGAAKAGFSPGIVDALIDPQAANPSIVIVLPPEVDLEGIVIDGNGKPLEGVRVMLDGEPLRAIRRALKAPLGDVYGSPLGVTASDYDGHFVAAGLLPGKYAVKVFHRDYALPQALEVELPRAGVLEIVLQEGSSATGIVYDAEKGEPIAEGTVYVHDMDAVEDERSFQVAPTGEFQVTSLRPDLLYSLRFHAKGYEQEIVRRVAPGTNDLVVAMKPIPVDVAGMGGKLEIHFTSAGYNVHELAGYFLVGIFDEAGNRQGAYRRGGAVNGTLALNDLPEGVFDLAISSDRYAPVVLRNITIGPKSPPLEVDVKPGCVVRGVESPPESIPPTAVLEIRDPEHDFPLYLVTGSPGGWNLGVLEAGKPFIAAITDEGATIGREEFVASGSEPVQLHLSGTRR